MIIKIVKVFTLESLDLFLTLCYNMIDVEIGLAAESFGQFGEGFTGLALLRFHKTNSVRGSLVGADNT